MPVKFGIDQLVSHPPRELRSAKIGLVTSNVATRARARASTTATGETSRVALKAAGVNLVRLFGPEHGLGGTAADGAHISNETDPLTNLPVVSLYGEHLRPTSESIADLDALVFDIPDCGARFYTYIWTLSYLIEAAAETHKPLYVLDRPNPIGGDLDAVEGPGLDEINLSSFVGRWNIPVRYSLTIGELARLWNAERRIGCDLRVIAMDGWRRQMHWPETGNPFVPMSPAMRSYETALLYPGTCLIEGTKLSEGRGTDSPFRLIGAPWIDGQRLATELNDLRLPGLRVDPQSFTPEGRKYAGELCGGVLLTVTDPRTFRPVAAGLHLIHTIIRLWPDEFEWLPYPTAANKKGLQHFDRLIGRADIRPALTTGNVTADQITEWTSANDWPARAAPHLLYPV